jgi:hypothetical protein
MSHTFRGITGISQTTCSLTAPLTKRSSASPTAAFSQLLFHSPQPTAAFSKATAQPNTALRDAKENQKKKAEK